MDNHDGLLVMHGTGAGKTLTAITVSQCYLDKNAKNKVVFVGPASLASNFRKELKRYGLNNDQQYEFYSFDKFYNEDKAKRPVNLKNKMLIVDEAHNLRNPKSLKSLAVQKAAFKADKRLLLSATPFVNNLEDFIPLINMIYGKKIVGTRKQFYNKECDEYLSKDITDENLSTLRYLLRDKLDFYMNKDTKDYPTREDHIIKVNATVEYYKKYEKLIQGENTFDILFNHPEKFYNAHRRAVNKAGPKYYSMKINHILPKLKQGKCIVYTNWIDFGIGPITTALKQNNISYRVFYGDTPMDDRQKIVNDYNDNKFQVLILTKAGGEGIDLKGTKNVVIMDPTWNDAGLEQIIGRAIRYKSHEHLPKSQRKVNVYFMLLKQPKNITTADAAVMGDVKLYAIIEQKNEMSAAIRTIIQEMSI
jgi:SNF2 family DNA or RNA helicase